MKNIILSIFMIGFMACNTNEGKVIPNLNLSTIDGELISSKSLKGEVTILCVWATWCGDCVREIPELNALVAKYKDNGKVNFIALSDENEATVRASLYCLSFDFKHIVNAGDYSDQLKTGVTKHFPQVLVVDKNLKVVFDVTENKDKIFKILDTHIQNNLK